MGKKPDIPSVLNQRTAKRLLESCGWVAEQGGKHLKMTKPGHRPITLPQHRGRDYPAGLASAILRQAGLMGPGRGSAADE